MNQVGEEVAYKLISSFDADSRLQEFKKSKREEEFIQQINKCLLPLQKLFEQEGHNSRHASHSIILILGTPRSGSTLLSQVIASRLDVGYPSNLMARFYETPAVGAYLQKILIGNRFHKCRKYKSVHGVTQSIEEPHEFGYFWARFLGVCKDVHEPNKIEMKKVNFEKLNANLNSIVNVFDKTVVFKCPLGNFFIPILKCLKNVFFIDMRRHLLDTACSCWRVREERFGSVDTWWSLRPSNYALLKELPPAQQIAGQLLAIRNTIDKGLNDIEESRKIIVQYEHFTQKPEIVIDDLVLKLKKNGILCSKVGLPVPPLPESHSIEGMNKDNVSLLRAALKYKR